MNRPPQDASSQEVPSREVPSREVPASATTAPGSLPSINVEPPLPPAEDAYEPPRLRFSLIHLLTVMTVMTVLLGVARWEVRMLPFLQVAFVLAGVAVYCRTGALASALVGAAVFYVWLGAVIFFGLMPLVKAMQAAGFAFVMAAPATLGVGAAIGYFYGAYNDRRRRRERRAEGR